ncbi:valine--tRNA ligase [Acutalibacter muris]|uniref:Valine--tRNA ligase n=1 Tax=Acutalibacter muris TaxID=1796620 RepID=A0A1Z2XMQ2_9FIRM|nr:valine--tRNA ligase [Acutalibacter muris]ANU53613.1 valine--tRNA ligase [Hungateiclostridiaceae bacterium KB18]ASB39712.1 valine--tRNA ligase [Acutalibacter muris]QQR29005.1 valine--tRNA ligase [Acutalibacter muris]
MSKELAKAYEPREVEGRIYDFWLKNKYFHAEIDPNKKPYTIMMPPPNVTDQLHVGHAMTMTTQDVLIRWKRMQGYSALWLPGTDHAALATEVKIVEAMAKEGIKKEDLGRDGFMERAWAWNDKYGGRIIEQLKLLGSSADWDRQRFTLDEGCSKAVRHVFVKLYEKGLIYRGERMTNYCAHCGTALSDAEVEFEEKDGSFWHLKYPLADGSGYVQLATTRPETMLGDTALAVHPEDERYKDIIGKNVILPLVNKEIPVVADEYVEMDFGTGVVKITPAHDPNDFLVGQRHDLPVITIMDGAGNINENGGKYQGLSMMEARKQIVKDLEEGGYLLKVEPIKHNVGTCHRCHTPVEPRVSTQWFVKMESMAKPAIEAVRQKKIKIIPERLEKVYYNWMENIKDWCISRQIWWGHRIPAWYCDDCGEIFVSEEDIAVCPKCGKPLRRDEDTLDTWFSSALWPFSTLGWPEDTEDLRYFYPTNTLVTGWDIIFFWVARMIFSGIEQTGEIPFDTVFFHGLVRDAQGRKMSKSLGNGVDPVEVIDKYGADALRLTIITGTSPGNDTRYSDEKVAASRNFANKIWNAARFIHMNIDGHEVSTELPEELTLEDKWIVSKFNRVARDMTENLERFELGVAVQKVYDFMWGDFCDWYIELSKGRMDDGNRRVLCWVLGNTLKLLHPFMPFITEEIWQSLPHEGEAIMVSKWPEFDEKLDFPAEEAEMEKVMELITAVRTRRSEMNVPPSRKAHLYIETGVPEAFDTEKESIARLAYCSGVETGESFNVPGAVTVVTSGCRAYLPMDDLIDREAEVKRLTKELESAKKQLETVENKLGNETFMSKAPQNVIDGVRANGEKLKEKVQRIEEALEGLK